MTDQPWVIRTYSGHSSATASNELYRRNLAKGQTGLSIAFDLPTQIGYDPDAREAAGEVGKVGVPVAHLGHMAQLLAGIPVEQMNTSMTINATAPWLLGCYVANAENRNVNPVELAGTTQNDFNIKAVLRLKDNLELNAFGQAEFWKVPALATGPEHDFTGSVQITYYPKLSWRR